MAENPQTSPKEHARWFIPSTYNDHDARIHEVQRQYGSFGWLTLDVDTNNLSLEDIDAALSQVTGHRSQVRLLASSTRHDPQQKKTRNGVLLYLWPTRSTVGISPIHKTPSSISERHGQFRGNSSVSFSVSSTILRCTSSGMRYQTCLDFRDWSFSPAPPRCRYRSYQR